MATTKVTLDGDYVVIATAKACLISTVGGGAIEIVNDGSVPANTVEGHKLSNVKLQHLLVPDAGNWYCKVVSPRAAGSVIVTLVG